MDGVQLPQSYRATTRMQFTFCNPFSRKFIHKVTWRIKKLNEGNKCFEWCYIRHLNPIGGEGGDLQQINKSDKEMFSVLIMKTSSFLFIKKVIKRLKQKTISLLLMYLDIKISECIQFIYQKRILRITWNYCG